MWNIFTFKYIYSGIDQAEGVYSGLPHFQSHCGWSHRFSVILLVGLLLVAIACEVFTIYRRDEIIRFVSKYSSQSQWWQQCDICSLYNQPLKIIVQDKSPNHHPSHFIQMCCRVYQYFNLVVHCKPTYQQSVSPQTAADRFSWCYTIQRRIRCWYYQPNPSS